MRVKSVSGRTALNKVVLLKSRIILALKQRRAEFLPEKVRFNTVACCSG